jgi:hypothetical protein
MRKVSLSLLALIVFILPFCTSSKKSSKNKVAKVTYMSHIQPLMVANCSPCHMPPKGNKTPYNTYAAVKTDIDDILARIQKNPNEKGFMPMRHPKLSDSTISVFAKWKADDLLEK